jgi:tetratricopeptide (TPR) repeat protein
MVAQEKKPEDKYFLAVNFEQNNELEKAKEIYLDLLKTEPANYNFFSAVNRVCVRLKEYDRSIKIIEERLKANPADYNLYGLLGNTYYAKGEIEKAGKEWEKGLAVQPKSIPQYRAIAGYAVQNKAYEKAIEYYLMGEKTLRNNEIFVNEIFNLCMVQFKFEEAAVKLCELLLTQPEYIAIGKSAMYSYMSRTDVHDKFIEIASKYLAKSGKTVFKEMLAFIYQLKGESGKAFELIKEIEAGNKTNGSAIHNFAQECFANRNYEAASQAFKYIIENYSESPFLMQARVYYPQALESLAGERGISNSGWKLYSLRDTAGTGEYNSVIKAYEENVRLYPKSEIQNEALLKIGLIQKEILSQNETAEKTLNQIVKNNTNSQSFIAATEKLAELNLLKNGFSEAEKLCNKIIQAPFADSLSKRKAHFLLGKNYYWQGDFNKALDQFKEIIYDYSNDLSNDAIEISAIVNSSKKDSLLLLDYAKADFLLFKKNFRPALELLQKTAQSENQILNDAAKYRWAMVMAALNSNPEALKILEEISSSDNSNYADNAYFSAGNIYYFELKDFRSAKEKFEKLLEIFPGSILTDKAREMLNIIKNKLEIGNDNK